MRGGGGRYLARVIDWWMEEVETARCSSAGVCITCRGVLGGGCDVTEAAVLSFI